jgi:hypothetical protein
MRGFLVMRKILEITDIFELPEHGVIISGVNPELDSLSKAEIKKLIGRRVTIRFPEEGETELEVKDIDAPSSLIGRKNIQICLGFSVNVSDLKVGSTVY